MIARNGGKKEGRRWYGNFNKKKGSCLFFCSATTRYDERPGNSGRASRHCAGTVARETRRAFATSDGKQKNNCNWEKEKENSIWYKKRPLALECD